MFSAVCNEGCGESPACYESETEAKRAAVWHVYDTHPEVWKRVIGDRPPLDPRPAP